MARTIADRVDRLEDWVLEAAPSLKLLQEAQAGVVKREERLDDLEHGVAFVKGAAWVLGLIFLFATTIIGLLLSRGG